jgi:UDP-glucuronate decarboxylase
MYGDGTQSRSFCFISDTVSAIAAIAQLEKPPQTPVNIGNPNEMSMKELSNKIIRLTNSDSIIAYQELPEDDPKQRCPDITLAKSILNWKPKVDIEQGLSETIIYYQKMMKNANS